MDQRPTLETLLDRAALLAEGGDMTGAYAAARQALDLRPDARRALILAARLALAAGRHDDAARHAREAAHLDPSDAEVALLSGQAALAAGTLPEAIESLQRAVRLSPDDAAARLALGRAWMTAAEPEKALPHLRRAVALDPGDSPDARAWLAVAEDGPAVDLPPDFIRALFNQYADKFDDELRGTLGYRAPEDLAALVAKVVGPPDRTFDVLDLGCGTGLSGEAFRAFARVITGVDLSPRMAEKARARGIYAHVEVGDMAAALGKPGSFDLIIAVDALGYVGDLAPTFRVARAALRPHGWFAATAEKNPDPNGAALSPARRFRHGEAYIRRTAAAAGFACAAIEETTLRRDRGHPVIGLAFVLSPAGD